MENNNNRVPVPYAVHEGITTRLERINRRLVFVAVLCIVLLFATNAAWLYAWMSYDYESSETYTTERVQQDGDGVNVLGNGNEVTDGSDGND